MDVRLQVAASVLAAVTRLVRLPRAPVPKRPPHAVNTPGSGPGARQRGGFTLIEVMIVAVIMGVLAALAIPNFARVRERAQIARAIGDIKALGMDLTEYQFENGAFPATLADIGRAGVLDPWGNAYRYVRVSGSNRGALRKDRFLVPINSDFDLYSMGPDGATSPALTAATAKDDIVRANDGGFVGVAENY